MSSEDPTRGEVRFVDSEWFRRGWTLQELLAPEVLVFFNCSWTRLGDKLELGLFVRVATAIENLEHYDAASIAQKMSWAAKRRTTRIEDRAYSLMGIFGIHMSPIYGEGERAFLRLQLEIIKIMDDESVFAWRHDRVHPGLLANSPDAFEYSGHVRRYVFGSSIRSFEMTNKGLRLESPLFAVPSEVKHSFPEDEVALLLLNCVGPSGADTRSLVLLGRTGPNTYNRIHPLLLVNLHLYKLEFLRNQDGDIIDISTFYVKQFTKGFLPARGPYTFKTRTVMEVRGRFKFSGLNDAYVSDPIRGQWSVFEGGEMVLETTQLPATGINATLIIREIDSHEDTSDSKTRMNLFIVIQIYKNSLEYQSILLPAESNIDDSVTVLRLWKREPARKRQQVGLDLDRKFGPSVHMERSERSDSYDSYDIVIKMGQVALVEYGSSKLF